jgi:hypothetical protein
VITHTREKIKQSSAITIESKQTTPKFNDLNNYFVMLTDSVAKGFGQSTMRMDCLCDNVQGLGWENSRANRVDCWEQEPS